MEGERGRGRETEVSGRRRRVKERESAVRRKGEEETLEERVKSKGEKGGGRTEGAGDGVWGGTAVSYRGNLSQSEWNLS